MEQRQRNPPLSLEEIWRRYDAMEVRLSAPLSERMLDLAHVGPGMRVLDLATGRGEPAVRAAHRVGPRGLVVGIDTAPSMLTMAKERADREGIVNLALRTADAATPGDLPEPAFDAVLCRWGLMYMERPGQALAEVRKRMTESARLVLAVWAEPTRVPYFSLPRQILSKWRSIPPIEADRPGVFRYASEAVLEAEVVAYRFEVERVEEHDVTVMDVSDATALVAWVRAFGLDSLVRDLPADVQEAWAADLGTEVLRLNHGSGYRLGGVARLVVARCDRDTHSARRARGEQGRS
jgi:ubiquinone/menaquinone biosynthesis C-methylase UbiE